LTYAVHAGQGYGTERVIISYLGVAKMVKQAAHWVRVMFNIGIHARAGSDGFLSALCTILQVIGDLIEQIYGQFWKHFCNKQHQKAPKQVCSEISRCD
jgi:hypothetical protein